MDAFDNGSDYEVFMGRWSRLIAQELVQGLDAARGLDWLDVGCGTGALVDAVSKRGFGPRSVNHQTEPFGSRHGLGGLQVPADGTLVFSKYS